MEKPNILVVDDDIELCNFFQYLLEEEKGYRPVLAYSGKKALENLEKENFNLALVDLKLPDIDGLFLLKEIKKNQPGCQVIIMTGYSTIKTAVEAIKLGALDYLEKPFEELSELEEVIERGFKKGFKDDAVAGELYKAAQQFGIIFTPGSPMQRCIYIAKKIAPKSITVLLEGETGTGKEALARFIHFHSQRASNPFFVINCGALPETLLESELFGHEKGSFTGAHERRKGIFELAAGGTLLLDEISEAPFSTQVKFLRVLETGDFMRVGGDRKLKADVRIIAATNKNLGDEVERGHFRKDLFYRLDVINLEIPPLRQRLEDIPVLVDHFISRDIVSSGEEEGVQASALAMELLKNYRWPGNIRELANVVTRAAALREGKILDVEHLPEKIIGRKPEEYTDFEDPENVPAEDIQSLLKWWGNLLPPLVARLSEVDLQELQKGLKEVESDIMCKIINIYRERTGGTFAEVAEQLGVTERKVRYLLHEKGKDK